MAYSRFMDVLVTGGTGFLGGQLVRRLVAKGRRVTVLTRSPAPQLEKLGVRLVQADLTEREKVVEACRGHRSVFHTAARVGVWGSYGSFFRANVLGTRWVIEGCRRHGVEHLVYTSTPSVVYNGRDLAGADESLPYTRRCPSPYPLTKAIAEREVLAANDTGGLRTLALRPHLIWGPGDRHLIPRVLARARAGRLRIIGKGHNRVDLVHIENAVDAHLLAEAALENPASPSWGRPYFITNGEPVLLWDWINELLAAFGESAVRRRLPLAAAWSAGAACEALWTLLARRDDPPMTRFIATELAKDHHFSIEAARRDLGYDPRISMAEGLLELISDQTRR